MLQHLSRRSLLLLSLGCVLIVGASVFFSTHEDIIDVDFDISLGTARLGKHFFYKREIDHTYYDTYHQLWYLNRPKNVISRKIAIPKIIHQIHLSSEALPALYKKYQATWKKSHPHWRYYLWSEKEVAALPARITAILAKAQDVEEKEQLLKTVLLLEMGGVIVDNAFECLRPLDGLHEKYDFYASLEPPLLRAQFGSVLHISPLIIGSVPQHPIIHYWQQKLCENYATTTETYTGRERTLICAGLALDKAVQLLSTAKNDQKNIVLPPTYFFPFNAQAIIDKNADQFPVSKKQKRLLSLFSGPKQPIFSSIATESYALHHRGGFWAAKLAPLPKSNKKDTTKKMLGMNKGKKRREDD